MMKALLKFCLFMADVFEKPIYWRIFWNSEIPYIIYSFWVKRAYRIECVIKNSEIKVGDIVKFTNKSYYDFGWKRFFTKGKVIKIDKKISYPYCVRMLNNFKSFFPNDYYVFTRKEIKKAKGVKK